MAEQPAKKISENPQWGKEAWLIGSEVYIAPKGSGLDTFGHPMGKRWESSLQHWRQFSAMKQQQGWTPLKESRQVRGFVESLLREKDD